MSLEFTPEHEKSYKELSTSVAVALPEMKGKDLVPNLPASVKSRSSFCTAVALPWASLKKGKHSAPAKDSSVSSSPTPPGSPKFKHLSMQEHCLAAKLKANPKATAHMQTKAKTTRTVRATITVVIVLCISTGSLIPRILWKSTGQASNILSQSASSHVSVRRTQMPPCFTSTMSWLPSFLSSTAKSTKGGRHITNAPFISTIFCNHQAPVRKVMRRRRLSGSRRLCGTMSHKCLMSSERRNASPLRRHVEFSRWPASSHADWWPTQLTVVTPPP